jgi:hypothetical protein
MNSYIKYIIETFNFDSINKKKSAINAHDIVFNERLNSIVDKIINKPSLGIKDKNFILSLPVASYKTNNEEIRELVKKCIRFFGNDCDLNWIDTYDVTNMNYLFFKSKFNGNIS